MIFKMKNFKKSDVFLLGVILFVTFSFWRHIPSLQFVGEGFQYFAYEASNIYIRLPLHHDLLAKTLFNVLPHIFNDSVHLYMWFLFIVMLLIDAIFYIGIRTITKSKLVGALSTIFLSLSYVANYDMYSAGGYQYFVQRGILLLFLLPAFCFFVLYFNGKFLLKYYVLSFTLFVTGIILGFFGTWFLPLFIFYPILYFLFNFRIRKKIFAKTIWTPFPFLVGNILIIKQSGFIPSDESILDFIVNKFLYAISGILQQLAFVTFPISEIIRRLDHVSSHFQGVLALTFIWYVSAFFIILRIDRKLAPLAATALVSSLTMFLFNIYLNAANVLNSFWSSRYFYFPFTMLALFWGIFFSSLFVRKGRAVFLPIVLVVWIAYNAYILNSAMEKDEFIQRANRETLRFLKANEKSLINNPSFVYLPMNLGAYGVTFSNRFYNHPDGRFVLQGFQELELEKLADEKFDPQNLYVLKYDTRAQKVIDKTEESRQILRQLSSGTRDGK